MIDINTTLDLVKLKFYNEWLYTAHIYDEGLSEMHGVLTTQVVKTYIDPLNIPKNAKILDLGCGPGYFLDEMKSREYTDVTGVTLSPGDIKLCEDKGHIIKKYDLSFLPQKDGYYDESVDFIFLRHALEHSPYPIFSLMEYNRILKQHGKIYIEVPAPNCVRKHEFNLNHYSIFGEQQLAALLNRTGFDINIFKDDEYLVYEALQQQSSLKVEEINAIIDRKNSFPVLKRLLDQKVIALEQELLEKYKPKLIRCVRLHPNYQHENGVTLIIGAIAFSFQIYGDFSGYSDIALGTAKLFGFELLSNFKFPYFSRDVAEFWRRWHISLSSWFRDYLYIPLGGSKNGKYKAIRNTFIIFIVSGFWHGANWTFIIWGALHGFYLIMEIVFDRLVPSIKLPRSIRWILNFVLVAIAWVFFRASNFQTAKQILKNIYTFKPGPLYIGNASYLVYSFFAILFLFAAEYNAEKLNNRYAWLYSERKVLRWSAYLLLILTLLSIGVFNGGQFIYFQF